MSKLTITLTLDDEQARCLIETLKIGAANRFAPELQRDSRAIAVYVEQRAIAVLRARARKSLRGAA